jgi:hypothetical protein
MSGVLCGKWLPSSYGNGMIKARAETAFMNELTGCEASVPWIQTPLWSACGKPFPRLIQTRFGANRTDAAFA